MIRETYSAQGKSVSPVTPVVEALLRISREDVKNFVKLRTKPNVKLEIIFSLE